MSNWNFKEFADAQEKKGQKPMPTEIDLLVERLHAEIVRTVDLDLLHHTAINQLRRLEHEFDELKVLHADRGVLIRLITQQREELFEALKIIEQDARVARPYVGQVSRLGGIARAAIQKHGGGAT